MAERPEKGVRRKVTFTAWCNHITHIMGWTGPEREYKGDAAFDLATHNIDRHGGATRGSDVVGITEGKNR